MIVGLDTTTRPGETRRARKPGKHGPASLQAAHNVATINITTINITTINITTINITTVGLRPVIHDLYAGLPIAAD